MYAARWREIGHVVDHARRLGVARGQVQVGILVDGPLFGRQFDVLAQDRFGARIVRPQAFHDDVERIGPRPGRGRRVRLVDHEAGRLAGVAARARQVQDHRDRCHRPAVVHDEFDRRIGQEVIQAQAVADVAAVRLQQDMGRLDPALGRAGDSFEHAVHHVAVDIARQGEPGVGFFFYGIFAHGGSLG